MKVRSLLAVVFLGLFARPIESQNRLPPVTLPDGPVFYNTIDQPRIRVVVLTEGLSHPWGMAFLPNGDMLVTEREGRLRVIRDGVLDPDPIPGVPEVFNETRFTGLMDIALHPQFADNDFVYLTYTKPLEDGGTVAVGVRPTERDCGFIRVVRERIATDERDRRAERDALERDRAGG